MSATPDWNGSMYFPDQKPIGEGAVLDSLFIGSYPNTIPISNVVIPYLSQENQESPVDVALSYFQFVESLQ